MPIIVPTTSGTETEDNGAGPGKVLPGPHAPPDGIGRDPAMANSTNHRRFGNVRALPSGRFQARWMGPDGHHHSAPETFATAEAADVWLASQVVDRADGRWVDRRVSSQTFAGVAQKWTERRRGAGYRVSTLTRIWSTWTATSGRAGMPPRWTPSPATTSGTGIGSWAPPWPRPRWRRPASYSTPFWPARSSPGTYWLIRPKVWRFRAIPTPRI